MSMPSKPRSARRRTAEEAKSARVVGVLAAAGKVGE